MPGFSSECCSNAHQACTTPDCRCQCHPATQALMRQPKKHGDTRGGVRRNLKKQISEAVGALPAIDMIPETELHNICPQCGFVAKPTDTFCRKDGTRLLMGKQCLQCGAPSEPDDVHCWQCGLKIGEKPPAPPVDESPAPEMSERDRLLALREKAKELGLLKETVVA